MKLSIKNNTAVSLPKVNNEVALETAFLFKINYNCMWPVLREGDTVAAKRVFEMPETPAGIYLIFFADMNHHLVGYLTVGESENNTLLIRTENDAVITFKRKEINRGVNIFKIETILKALN